MTTYYILDMNNNVLAEADGNKNITKLYIHGQGLIGMVTSTDSVYSYHFNAIGSAVAMTDQNQNVVNAYSYNSFGTVLNQIEAFPQPFKYVGQYGVMAEPNGFYYMRARYYDPTVGRFVSEDPIGFEGGDVNLSNDVGANPIIKIDPTGLKVYSCFGRLRVFPHAWVCLDSNCAGLMPIERNICPEGGMITTESFNPHDCTEEKLPKCCDQNKFEKCVQRLAISRKGNCERYGAGHLCTNWANEVIRSCSREACGY